MSTVVLYVTVVVLTLVPLFLVPAIVLIYLLAPLFAGRTWIGLLVGAAVGGIVAAIMQRTFQRLVGPAVRDAVDHLSP
jgi:hypothetical protein